LTILWRLHWPSVVLVAKYRDLKLRVHRAVMTRPVLTVALLENRIGGLPVTAGERLVGILTEVDLLRAFSTCAFHLFVRAAHAALRRYS